jgi:hypothetical protein
LIGYYLSEDLLFVESWTWVLRYLFCKKITFYII